MTTRVTTFGLALFIALGALVLAPRAADADCGDGAPNTDEECDDGNTADGDGCSATCQEEWGWYCNGWPSACTLNVCGDGVVYTGEECDDGANNHDGLPDACRTDCRFAYCGDGVIDTGEQCDDRTSSNSNTTPNACRNDCQLPICGDNVVDDGYGETCDDGNHDAGDGCGPTCLIEVCGNGFTELNETCDDGNFNNHDSCTRLCVPNVCGDGYVGPQEVCDDRGRNRGICSEDCIQDYTHCGDGIVDADEACDNGILNADAPEAVCRADCQLPRCGDGVVSGAEECDGDPGCSPMCQWIGAR